ncbi:hypothetical protein NT01EI_1784 [Edwardsiella ictaluri 93-146]|uniref:Uncharacterized protein n=1 Tax=Edwardsiella ictaluri (strain 93-146) TaxID=634503 RepID=C5BFK0_EDWI9|nr:hypothetical protein NT01EI_1784 [Edwardsiella ictaluri 93-146]
MCRTWLGVDDAARRSRWDIGYTYMYMVDNIQNFNLLSPRVVKYVL